MLSPFYRCFLIFIFRCAFRRLRLRFLFFLQFVRIGVIAHEHGRRVQDGYVFADDFKNHHHRDGQYQSRKTPQPTPKRQRYYDDKRRQSQVPPLDARFYDVAQNKIDRTHKDRHKNDGGGFGPKLYKGEYRRQYAG